MVYVVSLHWSIMYEVRISTEVSLKHRQLCGCCDLKIAAYLLPNNFERKKYEFAVPIRILSRQKRQSGMKRLLFFL